MTSKAPNDDAKGQPAPDSGRNDPAIDPKGEPEAGSAHSQPEKAKPQNGDSTTAEGNSYSPDFEPERKPEQAPGKTPRDADIDTDGG
ncbi:hypothetical protein [Pseudomonas sp. KNUC1026]|uniref:hypothetical protein n=1 Tax=Pseudomonas sp. KNUC1026 TaxID=2893890 RepID=UPI001F363B35|nr:hypothetical protein [Pseudomonas sp. KNUC1026]UFH50780.1 hypothetical protein LN139_06550 [Pseudomonas sp. KNUC1026]